jgi:tRNA A37 threonylcarbamoyladenosine synthetase subunit TsaC/SUA5/YrdC
VRREFGDRLAVVIDGGRCNGVPSTVSELTSAQPECLREGAIYWPEVLSAAVVT